MSIIIKNSNKSVNKLDKALLVLYYVDKENAIGGREMGHVSLSTTLKYFRKKAGLTQEQISKTLGVTRSSYAYYENGKSEPKLEVLQKIAALYNISLETLINGDVNIDVCQDTDFLVDLQGFNDAFYDLSDLEKSVVLKLRIMEKSKRTDILERIFSKNIEKMRLVKIPIAFFISYYFLLCKVKSRCVNICVVNIPSIANFYNKNFLCCYALTVGECNINCAFSNRFDIV